MIKITIDEKVKLAEASFLDPYSEVMMTLHVLYGSELTLDFVIDKVCQMDDIELRTRDFIK